MGDFFIGVGISVWAVGTCFYFALGMEQPTHRPFGWPWLIAFWPILEAVSIYRLVAERCRRRKLLKEAWKR